MARRRVFGKKIDLEAKAAEHRAFLDGFRPREPEPFDVLGHARLSYRYHLAEGRYGNRFGEPARAAAGLAAAAAWRRRLGELLASGAVRRG